MKNTDEIDALKPLARITPGGRGGDPAGAGARALLTAVTSEEPGVPARTRRRARRRPFLGLATTVALAAGAVVGPSLLEGGTGLPSSYAVTRAPDGAVTVYVRDFRDAAGLERRLRELNVPAVVDHVPYGKMCREPRGRYVLDIPQGLYSVPQDIPGEKWGWRMRIDTRLFRPGQTFVWTVSAAPDGQGGQTTTYLVEGSVAPCEPVPAPEPKELKPEFRAATFEGGSLEGLRVDEKTVGEVLPELRRRGRKVLFAVISVPPGNPGGYGVEHVREEPVGDHWTVWEAEENREGVVRLLVTEERYDRNPVYGGPRDAVVPE